MIIVVWDSEGCRKCVHCSPDARCTCSSMATRGSLEPLLHAYVQRDEPEEEMIRFSVRDLFSFSVRRRQVSFKKKKTKKIHLLGCTGCIPYSKFVRNRRASLFFCPRVWLDFSLRGQQLLKVQRDGESGSVLIWWEAAVSSSVESGLRERGLVRKRLRIWERDAQTEMKLTIALTPYAAAAAAAGEAASAAAYGSAAYMRP